MFSVVYRNIRRVKVALQKYTEKKEELHKKFL